MSGGVCVYVCVLYVGAEVLIYAVRAFLKSLESSVAAAFPYYPNSALEPDVRADVCVSLYMCAVMLS